MLVQQTDNFKSNNDALAIIVSALAAIFMAVPRVRMATNYDYLLREFNTAKFENEITRSTISQLVASG